MSSHEAILMGPSPSISSSSPCPAASMSSVLSGGPREIAVAPVEAGFRRAGSSASPVQDPHRPAPGNAPAPPEARPSPQADVCRLRRGSSNGSTRHHHPPVLSGSPFRRPSVKFVPNHACHPKSICLVPLAVRVVCPAYGLVWVYSTISPGCRFAISFSTDPRDTRSTTGFKPWQAQESWLCPPTSAITGNPHPASARER